MFISTITHFNKNMQKLLTTTFLMLLLTISIEAQESGSLYGKVVDQSNGESLIGVNLFLYHRFVII